MTHQSRLHLWPWWFKNYYSPNTFFTTFFISWESFGQQKWWAFTLPSHPMKCWSIWVFPFISLKKGDVVWLLSISIHEISLLIIINSDNIKMSNQNARTHVNTFTHTHTHTSLEVMKWLGYFSIFLTLEHLRDQDLACDFVFLWCPKDQRTRWMRRVLERRNQKKNPDPYRPFLPLCCTVEEFFSPPKQYGLSPLLPHVRERYWSYSSPTQYTNFIQSTRKTPTPLLVPWQ